LSCNVTPDVIFAGGPGRDGIPALVNPKLVPVGHPETKYLEDFAAAATGDSSVPNARVIGLEIDGVPVAIPHNIMWWHEIVNLEVQGRLITVTYCPLTGSALAFDATEAGTTRFGVSGLIFQNNLIMFDDETGSLWPQMCGRAALGDRTGHELVHVPTIEMRWEEWRLRHPNTLVISSETGYIREYGRYPYLAYELSESTLFALPRGNDDRRRFKERIFGIPSLGGGIAYPFEEFASVGAVGVANVPVDGEIVQVIWDGAAETAAAYFPRTTTGDVVTLQLHNGSVVDRETGTTWDVEGRGVAGPRTGERLVAHAESYVAYWFAWVSFYPKTQLWTAE
jgi:hypothetical protein